MSNVINLGWEPLQFVMRDIPEEFKHLPFTDEMNQLLLSALSSGELVQNNYYGIDSNYYRTRYGNPENLASPACPPSSTNTYSQSSPQSATSTPPISASSSPSSNQLSPTQTKTMAPKIQPPSIQLPTTQMPVSSSQLSPKYMQSQMQHAQMHNLPKSNQTQPQMQQLQPQMLQSQQLLQAQMSQSQIQQISQAQLAQMSQSQLGQQIQPQLQQTQNRYTTKSPVPPAQSQLQQQQLQQMQLQNQIQANQEPTRLQSQLLQHLQQQRQQVAQVNNQPSPPQNQSRSPSPTPPLSLQPPSPETAAQPQSRQHVHPLMQQQLSYAQPVVHSQFNVTPQMLPAHLSNPHLLNQMQQYQQLQQMQQAQVPQVQPAQQSAQAHKPSQPQHATPQVQPQPQQSQSQPQSQVNQSPPQVQVQSQSPPSQSQAPSQSQFLRTVSLSPPMPLEPLSPTVYQFVNVKDEQDPTKSKPLTEKQKNRRRASQNLASRNYRQRKKEYITTMEDRTQDLERQAEQLRRQLNQKEVIISKLAKENAELRLEANLEAKNHEEGLEDIDGPIDANMQDIILKLERTVKLETIETSEDAERTGLNATLKAFYGSLQDRHERYTQQVKEIVNPCTQAKLSALDSDPTSPFDNGFTENDDAWWTAFSAEADIDEEQTNKIKEVRRDHFIEFQRLRTERRDLNKDIRSYYKMVFSSAIGGAEELEADTRMEELVEKLTSLKQNLDDEKRLILQTHEAMAKILTPRQEAILVTQSYNKVVRSNAAIQMVTNMYEVVLKENALAKCCAPGWEVL